MRRERGEVRGRREMRVEENVWEEEQREVGGQKKADKQRKLKGRSG